MKIIVDNIEKLDLNLSDLDNSINNANFVDQVFAKEEVKMLGIDKYLYISVSGNNFNIVTKGE